MLELVAIPGAAPWVTPLLCGVAALGAALTTAVGAGGGLLLLGVMTLFLPVAGAIPLHGVIQLGANGGRALLLARHVRLALVAAFAAGAVIGVAAAAQVLVRLSEPALQLLLGGFIVLLAWVPLPRLRRAPRGVTVAAGALTSALTLFVGATGPLVAAFLKALRLERMAHVGTFAACMLLQHGLKLVVFGLAGFVFTPYLGFLAVMVLSTVVGNWAGRHLLRRLGDARFDRALTVVLTLLALRLLYEGARGAWG